MIRRIGVVWICMILVASALLLLTDIPQNASAASPPIIDGGTVYWNQDWYVDNGTSLEYVNQTIVLSGHLQINATGSLTFRNVTLVMNCSFGAEFNITSYGTFTLSDFDSNITTKYDRSRITSPGTYNGYYCFIKPNSSFSMSSCDFLKSALNSGGSFGGLIVESNGFLISDSTFIDYETEPHSLNSLSIINVIGGTIINCNFSYGHYIYPSGFENGLIKNNTFFKSHRGIYVAGGLSRNIIIDNNTFDTTEGGGVDPLNIRGASEYIISNNVFLDGAITNAIYLWPTCDNFTIINNYISDFGNEGIQVDGGEFFDIINNTVIGTKHGIYVRFSANNINIDGNELVGNDYGLRTIGSHNITLTNNNISDNYIGV